MTVIKAKHARSLLKGIEECTDQMQAIEELRGRNIKLQVENDEYRTIYLSPSLQEHIMDVAVGWYLEHKNSLIEQLDKL